VIILCRLVLNCRQRRRAFRTVDRPRKRQADERAREREREGGRERVGRRGASEERGGARGRRDSEGKRCWRGGGEGRTGGEPVARESKKRDQVRPDSNTRGTFVCSTVALWTPSWIKAARQVSLREAYKEWYLCREIYTTNGAVSGQLISLPPRRFQTEMRSLWNEIWNSWKIYGRWFLEIGKREGSDVKLRRIIFYVVLDVYEFVFRIGY